MRYEVVREIQNLCGNNQMRDVSFFEVLTDDPVAWVRQTVKGENVHIDTDVNENGDLTVFAENNGLSQKFLFSEI